MKRSIFLFCLLIFSSSAQDPAEEVNPEDVDDVKPPVAEIDANKLNNGTTTVSVTVPTAVRTNITEKSEPVKTEVEKKEELLTGKEETAAPKADAVPEQTTLSSETKVPDVRAEKNEDEKETEAEKENAAPEFEVKQEVEGGKGEEDPDANVDKPEKVDPPKDEADGAAKEDRETPAVGAEGLHEAVEEARGNPAPAAGGAAIAAAGEVKKDSADDEQTLDAVEPAPIRPMRIEMTENIQSNYSGDDTNQSTGFMSFFMVATFLVVFVYILQHNKKKILGLMFEGRTSSTRRTGNVKYRRLSQNEG